MNAHVAAEIMRELVSRGYAPDGNAPNGTMELGESYIRSVELGELFDMLVARREKVFRSTEVVGPDPARKSYDDVVIAVDALKTVISRLVPP